MPERSAVLLFAKVPRPGHVKTRLVGVVSPQQAAEIHRACLEDTARQLNRVQGPRKELWVAARMARCRQLARALGLGREWCVRSQRGGDLGERMRRALESTFGSGIRKVVIVGSDTPWMGAERIRGALRMLEHAEVVLGPTADGGYYLVGAKRLIPATFGGIPWGTSRVLPKTLAGLRQARVSYRLLKKDFDLDRPADLGRAARLLRRKPNRSPALARWLKKWSAERASKSSRPPAPARRNKTRRPGPG